MNHTNKRERERREEQPGIASEGPKRIQIDIVSELPRQPKNEFFLGQEETTPPTTTNNNIRNSSTFIQINSHLFLFPYQ